MEVLMSRNIFTSALLVAIMVVLVAGNVQAQAKNDNIQASATVVANVSIAGTTAMTFGTIGSSTPSAVVLDPNATPVNHNVGTDAAVGMFTLTGANKSSLAFTFANTPLAGTATPANTILFTPNVIGGATQAAATTVTSGTAYSIDGTYYLWVGGSLPQLTLQNPDVYHANFNIAVDYN
jgi:hypothetical protein